MIATQNETSDKNTAVASDKRMAKAAKAQAAFADLLAKVGRPGYYGAATLSLNLQDGHVEQVKVATERVVR